MKKNGFTLIELLAIIVILAIVAVITVPIILNIIDNSKKGAAKDSAYGFKEAVQKYYVSKLSYDMEEELPSGYKLVSELPNDFSVSGDVPTSDSWVQLEKGQIVAYSLKFGDYTVTKYKDSDVVCEKGNVEENEETRAARLRLEAQTEASSDVASYISLLLLDSTIQAYTEDVSKKVSQISTPSAPEGVDTNSWIYFKKEESSVITPDYSIKIAKGDYTFVINSVDGTVASPVLNGELLSQKQVPVQIIIKRDGTVLTAEQTISVADTVTLRHGSYNDGFVVIEVDSTNNTATLLADNNINTSTGFQGVNGQNYPVAFAGSQYWASCTDDIYDSSKNDASGMNYSVAYHVNNYVTNLRSVGFTQVQTTGARILKKSEVVSGGIAESYINSGENYWLDSASYGDGVNGWHGYITYSAFTYTNYDGVRPVIVISTSDI